MKRMNIVLLGLCVLCAGAHAREPALDAQALMQQMAGVYKERFKSAYIVPGKPDQGYETEDVVEIVPFDADHLYVRTHLEFYNGHTCDMVGMARYEDGRFVYHDPAPPLGSDPPCVFRVGVENGRLVLTDRDQPDGVSSCRAYCGLRGSLNYTIGLEKRRPIRYMARLKASREYARAVDDMRKTGPQAAH